MAVAGAIASLTVQGTPPALHWRGRSLLLRCRYHAAMMRPLKRRHLDGAVLSIDDLVVLSSAVVVVVASVPLIADVILLAWDD